MDELEELKAQAKKVEERWASGHQADGVDAQGLKATLDRAIAIAEKYGDDALWNTTEKHKAIAAGLALRDALHGTGPNDHQVLMDTAWLEEHR